MNKKVIGILGGMGPMATVDIFSKIVQNTPATKDEDHIRILIDNNPEIPSRVEAILHNGKSPVPEMQKMAKGLETSGADFIIIPCNTASYYTKEIQKEVTIPVLNIVEETSKYVLEKFTDIKTVGILATEMTERLGLYQKHLIENEVELICKEGHCALTENVAKYVREKYPTAVGINLENEYHIQLNRTNNENNLFNVRAPYLDTLKKYITKAIYGKQGIKAGNLINPKKKILKAIKELKEHGVKTIILGCTELPLVITEKEIMGVNIVDPTLILAQRSIEKSLNKKIF